MLKKIKLKNSTILLLGSVFIVLGIFIGLYDFFEERKNETFSNMNIILYENESPENIINSDVLGEQEQQDIPDASENNNVQEENNNINSDASISYNYTGILEIPKINLKRGFYNTDSRYNNVDYNVTVIGGSSFPNIDNSNLILAAHSGICTVCYFENLYKLKLNDEAYIYYGGIKYVYKIVDIYEVEKDGTVPIYRDYNKKTLTLITCTRNSNTKQTVYILELI